MDPRQRNRFDAILERVLDELPPRVLDLLEEVPLIVEDEPSKQLIRLLASESGEDPAQALSDMPDTLCGLHTGVALTERSVESSADLPDQVQIFRRGVIATAGGWGQGEGAIAEEIRVTILHEVGHHFGLDEDDLADLGYD